MKYIITAPTNKPYAASDKENNTPASKILFPNSRKRKRFIQSKNTHIVPKCPGSKKIRQSGVQVVGLDHHSD